MLRLLVRNASYSSPLPPAFLLFRLLTLRAPRCAGFSFGNGLGKEVCKVARLALFSSSTCDAIHIKNMPQHQHQPRDKWNLFYPHKTPLPPLQCKSPTRPFIAIFLAMKLRLGHCCCCWWWRMPIEVSAQASIQSDEIHL